MRLLARQWQTPLSRASPARGHPVHEGVDIKAVIDTARHALLAERHKAVDDADILREPAKPGAARLGKVLEPPLADKAQADGLGCPQIDAGEAFALAIIYLTY